MTIYAFHIFRGSRPLSLETAELSTDQSAEVTARALLRTHPSGSDVEVWEDDRAVATIRSREDSADPGPR